MILLVGIPSESPLTLVSKALEELSEPYVILNQRRFADTNFSYELDSGRISGSLSINGCAYDLASFKGIYTRMMDERSLPEYQVLPPDSAERRRCHYLHDALLRWMEITPARVLNRTGPMGSNTSKPYQAQLIAHHGFSIPETLITNEPALVRRFCRQHERVIFKSISGVRSIVQTVTDADLQRLDHIRWCPTQFQAFVPGTNVRVHVVGQQCFATRIASEATDYRYAGVQGSSTELIEVELDQELAERCVRLAAALRLPFAGIDLKVTPDQEVFCFEVNPSPGYSYYEGQTGQPISRAVADYLRGMP